MYIIHTIWSFMLYKCLCLLSNTRLRHHSSSRIILSRSYRSSSSNSSSMFSFVSYFTLNFSFSCRMISSTECWMVALLSCCLPNLLLVVGSCLQSLVGPYLSYLSPKSSKNFIHIVNVQGHG